MNWEILRFWKKTADVFLNTLQCRCFGETQKKKDSVSNVRMSAILARCEINSLVTRSVFFKHYCHTSCFDITREKYDVQVNVHRDKFL